MEKILFISESMGGGLRKHVVQLLNYLNDEFEIYFIHGTKNMDSSFTEEYDELSKKCTLIACPSFTRELSLKDDLKTSKFLYDQIRYINPDIVHCHSSKAGALGRMVAKLCKIEKIFYTPHAYSFLAPEFSENKKKFFIKIEKTLSKYCTTKTFCVSHNEKNVALNNNIDKSEKIKVIYNGLPSFEYMEKNRLKKILNLPLDKIIIGNNARFSKQKNPDFFVEIANYFKPSKQYHFVWVGDGPLRKEIELKIKRYELEDNITLLGDRSDSEMIVHSYDYYLSTALYEGLPYALIEALRAGVPIIATDVVGNNEIVIPGTNGQLINLKNIESIHQIFDFQYDEEEIVKSFNDRFSIDNMIDSIKKEYRAQ